MVKLLGSLEKEPMSPFLATIHLAMLCWGGEELHYQEEKGGTGVSTKKMKEILAVLCLHATTDLNVEKQVNVKSSTLF